MNQLFHEEVLPIFFQSLLLHAHLSLTTSGTCGSSIMFHLFQSFQLSTAKHLTKIDLQYRAGNCLKIHLYLKEEIYLVEAAHWNRLQQHFSGDC